MYKNTLFRLLKLLNRKEMTRFKEFVQSPYFNKHNKVNALVQYLSDIFPDFEKRKCGREKLFKVVFGAQKHDQAQLAIVFTYTKRLLHEFLAQEKWQEKDMERQIDLMKHIREKGDLEGYKKELKRSEKYLANYSFQDTHFQYLNYLFAKETDQFYEQLRQYKSDDSLQRKQNHLDYFYLSEKLRDACEILVRESTLQVEYASRLLDVLLTAIAENWEHYRDIPSIAVYHQIYQMLNERSVKSYQKTLVTLARNAAYFSPKEQQSTYLYLQNFCTTQINEGKSEFMPLLFDLIRVQLEKGFLFEQSYLSEWHYKNIVTLGLRVGKQAWIEQFIETYKTHLHPNQREHAYNFNLASLHYYNKQYSKALKLLLYLDLSDVRYAITAKSMLLYTYYELEELEALLPLSDTFRQYLKRQKNVSKDYRKGIDSLVRYTKKLALLRSKKAYEPTEKWQPTFEKLRQAILEDDNIVNKRWLLEKMEELTPISDSKSSP
ncbi:MAG: hypothetical protein AAF849_13725 [Bacteroidota bacterium]